MADRHAANIDLSVLFAGLRERAGLEERERLAREGMAQAAKFSWRRVAEETLEVFRSTLAER